MALPWLKITVETCFIFYDMLPTHTHSKRLHVKIEGNMKKISEFLFRVAEDVTLGWVLLFFVCFVSGNCGRAN